jgi:hypothetical protein
MPPSCRQQPAVIARNHPGEVFYECVQLLTTRIPPASKPRVRALSEVVVVDVVVSLRFFRVAVHQEAPANHSSLPHAFFFFFCWTNSCRVYYCHTIVATMVL